MPTSVVYYIAFEGFVKIGTSRNLTCQLAAVGGQELLAIKPGDHALEHMRHLEFAGPRFRGEWFRNEPSLTDLIARIRKAHGSPVKAYEKFMADTHAAT